MSSVEQKIIGFLEGLGARVTPIKTESLENRRTPDLLVNFHDIEMVVEIKAIENNPEEVNAIKAVGSGEVVTVSHDNDVDRFARKIRDANNQLKSKRDKETLKRSNQYVFDESVPWKAQTIRTSRQNIRTTYNIPYKSATCPSVSEEASANLL